MPRENPHSGMTIEIEFGNDAMLNADDAFGVLEALARRHSMWEEPYPSMIRDVNGNRVGTILYHRKDDSQ